ncbi:1-deoxy-D-xylulose-5-phosphate reductoisomerase, partial [Modestobacter lacusdianchii]
MSEPREVTVLGSTGSIGRQAIAVAGQNPDRLRVTGLAAGGGDIGLLAEQALSLGVRTVAVGRGSAPHHRDDGVIHPAHHRGRGVWNNALREL